ncbi:MAG: AI-2E family transporter [Ruminococcus sp.]|nr:AI-2E family transporter [Ruminococcus sp.]
MQNWLKTEGGTILNVALDTVIGTIGSVVGGIFDFFVAFVFSIYILFNKETLKKQCCRLIRAWLPKRFGEWFIHASSVLSCNLSSFITGQTIEAVILGSLCTIGMLILRIPYAPMIGALVGVTALIPVVGAFIGAGVGAFMILTVSPIKAVIFLIFIIILQQIEGNLIYPKVMGNRVNLPAIWILLAVTVGGSVAGPVGMLAAVPLASTIYILVREATEKREQKLAQKENKVQINDEKSIESDAK